ncbi:MAG: sigma-70 family RNA polymerase sigma factor [Candidatus Limnocylindrales bacterium]
MFRRGREEASRRARPTPYDADRPAVEAARRDPGAFEALYRKYVAQVYSFALYETRDQHAAEDLTEEVFVRALHSLPRFREEAAGADDESTFRVWLFQIARNALSNDRRWQRRHPTTPLDDAAFAIAAPADPAEEVATRDLAARAWAAVDALPEERRRALVLRYVEEMSAREIGLVLGRSEGAARVLVHRALRSVAERLAQPN